MKAHILHHTPFETAGSITPWLTARNAEVTETRFYERTWFPDAHSLDLLVVMGGVLSVNDEAHFTWLRDEKQFLRDAIAARTPMLGICLGSQLIASAIGARVSKNAYAEHGWLSVQGLAHGTSCFAFPSSFTAFQSHGETFDLPKGATQLARSAACENQAFQYDTHVIALQFHLEANAQSTSAIVEGCADEFAPGPFVQSQTELRATPTDAYQESARLMGEVLGYLVDD